MRMVMFDGDRMLFEDKCMGRFEIADDDMRYLSVLLIINYEQGMRACIGVVFKIRAWVFLTLASFVLKRKRLSCVIVSELVKAKRSIRQVLNPFGQQPTGQGHLRLEPG